MRLFISYARVDKPYCVQIAETLDIHEIWYDQRLYAGQQWWQEILRRLDWAEGFVYLLSPESVASKYCQEEFVIAQQRGLHIFPVKIHDQTPIPDALKHVQYADLSNGLTPEAVKTLLNAIYVSERQRSLRKKSPANFVTPTEPDQPPDLAEMVGKAAEALETGNFDEAVFLLKQAIELGFKSRFVNLKAILQDAELALERQSRLREAEREYKPIVELVKRGHTRGIGCNAFQAYRKDFPDHDPEDLAAICAGFMPAKPVSNGQPIRPAFTLPLLEWCEVPEGMLLLKPEADHGVKEVQYVEHFNISKFPVTNAQFDVFLSDPGGYANPIWWNFSEEACKWRQDNREPKHPRFKGDDRPRENLTWYEAMAFCNWLSDKTGLAITLPTDLQWQRAARGDDDRLYPWGNDFSVDLANTRESKIRMTTLVMRYDNALSPFDVYDMAGNVWEWCLNAGTKDPNNQEGDNVRAIFGGSFISVCERAQTHFHFNLSPEYHYATIGFRMVASFF